MLPLQQFGNVHGNGILPRFTFNERASEGDSAKSEYGNRETLVDQELEISKHFGARKNDDSSTKPNLNRSRSFRKHKLLLLLISPSTDFHLPKVRIAQRSAVAGSSSSRPRLLLLFPPRIIVP